MPNRRIDDPAKLQALFDAALAVESQFDLDSILHGFVENAVKIAGAQFGAIGVLDESRTGLKRFVVTGISPEQIRKIGPYPTGQGVLGLLIKEPNPMRLRDISSHPSSVGFPENHPHMSSFLGMPIRSAGIVYGNLYLANKLEAPEFTMVDEALISGLAAVAGVAIENVLLKDTVAELAVANDRERIARELHDTVMQRIFAVGLSVQSVLPLVGDKSARSRLVESVSELDETIRQIRTTIFSLGAAEERTKELRALILEKAGRVTDELGIYPRVTFSGAIDSQVSQETSRSLLIALEEGISNVISHARATVLEVDVTLEKGDVILEIRDDGIGIPPEGPEQPGKGISIMCEAAAKLGGSCMVKNGPRGVEILWRAPA